MTDRRIRHLVGFFVLSGAVAVGAGASLHGLDNHVGRSTTPTGYVGIVSADFEWSDADDEIVGDFGSAGVWAYHNGTWTRLTAMDPEWIFAARVGASDDELVADFGAAGLWVWDYDGWPGTWTQITASNAEGALASDDDGDGTQEFQVDFGSLGLWRFDWDSRAWTQYTALNPSGTGLRTDMIGLGQDEGVWAFSGLGVWAVWWGGSGAYWRQLSPSAPSGNWAAGNFVDPYSGSADATDELAVEFAGLGTWLFEDDNDTWTRLTSTPARALTTTRFGSDSDGELIFATTGGQPWWWGPSWQQLSGAPMDAGFVRAFDPDGLAEAADEDELAADFGTLGLWEYNDNLGAGGTWWQLTSSNPVFLVASDYYGDGAATSLIAWFGPGVGLWLWDSGGGIYPSAWHKLTDTAPDSFVGW